MKNFVNDLKGLFNTTIALLLIRFLKFIEWNPRTEGHDLRKEFFQFFDNLEINGDRVSYWQAHKKLMDGNLICKRWAIMLDKLYDELY